MELKIGQIWKENDNRFFREIVIIGFKPGCDQSVIIKTIKNISVFNNQNYKIGKITTVKERRFNGKSGGYTYLR